MRNFNEVKSRKDIAEVLNIPIQKLTYVLYRKKVESYYCSFEISKKSGGKRIIKAPSGDLKYIQKKLAEILYEYQKQILKNKGTISQISHGFEKGKSIVTNASVHKRKLVIINVDIENFFDSFHFGRVKGFFEKNMYFKLPSDVSVVIAQIVCYQGKLPQGAPTSPIITNLICQILDHRLLKLAKKYKLDYTRYADDLSFSTNSKSFLLKEEKFIKDVKKELSKSGFIINSKKTRICYKNSRQEVTGLIVNDKVNVNREFYKKTRAMANTLYKTNNFNIDGVQGKLEQLEGRFTFINQIDKINNNNDKNNHNYIHLNNREKDYQKFLFYKYFFASEKPVIITEGKTDILYLKAALKNLHDYFPALVTKKGDNEFQFKITFLQRTKRLNYFFGMARTGADAMANLQNYFVTYKNNAPHFPNYTKIFEEKSGEKPFNPVIFVFDNELNSEKRKDKPLKKFVNQIKLSKEEQETLNSELYLKIEKSTNLYLLTNPLVDNKTECEIEDLFDDNILNLKLNGKSFSREKDYDTNTHYSKDIFSKHIYKNYKSINFNEFKPFLEALQKIIESFKSDIIA